MQGVIINYYPPALRQIKEMQQIATAEDKEFEKLEASTDEVLKNMFVHTANELGVKRFEKILKITPSASQSLEDRKTYILSVMNSGKMSLSQLRQIISSYSHEIELIPNYEESELMVNIGEDISNTGMIFQALDEMLSLQIYIFFSMFFIFETKLVTMTPTMELKTNIKMPTCAQKFKMELGTSFIPEMGKQEGVTFEIIEKKHLRYFDGTINFDGSGGLFDSEIKREVL